MKPTPLTPEVAEHIISELRRYYKGRSTQVAGWVGKNSTHADLEKHGEVCFAPITGYLARDWHPDYFGIAYQGHSGVTQKQSISTPEALLWLEYLVNPEGPFRDALPFLYHTEAKEIIEDRGFVIHNALKSNAGLLWTFLQASRLMYEHPERMAVFLEFVEKSPQHALLAAMCLAPRGAVFMPWPGAHCNPLGGQGWQSEIAKNFLNGTPTRDRHDTHSPSGSWRCFGNTRVPDDYYRSPKKYQKSLEEWCGYFEEMRGKDVKIAA